MVLVVFNIGYSQNFNVPPNTPEIPSELECGDIIKKGTAVRAERMEFKCNWTLLMQDNSTLYIEDNIYGDGAIYYGDVGGGEFQSDGLKRDDFDRNPKIIILDCDRMRDVEIIVGDHIDVEYVYDDYRCNENGHFYTNEELYGSQIIVYNTIGQKYYEGLFDNIYDSNGKIKHLFANQVILIRVFKDLEIIDLKRFYIDNTKK